MAKRAEVRGLIARENGRFAKSLSSDIGMRVLPVKSEVEPTVQSLALIRNGLAQQGLGGEGHLFGADSRRHPIGLPVHMAGTEKGMTHAIGLYIPAAADKKLGDAGEIDIRVKNAMQSVFDANAREKLRLPFKDGLIAVNSQRVAHWTENGLHQTVTTDHSTHVTAEDEAWMTKKNEEALVVYVDAMLQSVGVLGMYGVKPRDLNDPDQPIRQVGGYTNILGSAFVNTDHSPISGMVVERDGGRCSMINMHQLELSGKSGIMIPHTEIPVCGRDLTNYYPQVGPNRHRVELGVAGQNERNHAIARGGGMVAAFKAAWSRRIPLDVYDHPERLLLTLSTMNVPELTGLNGIDLAREKAEVMLLAAQLMPKIDAAVNNVYNLVLADARHHHDWYHPDEGIAVGISSFLSGVNTGRISVPLVDIPMFASWKENYAGKILNNQRVSDFEGDFGDRMKLIQQARMLVGMQGRPYWQDISTRLLIRMARKRTREYVNSMVEPIEDGYEDLLERLAGNRGATVEDLPRVMELVGDFYQARPAMVDSLHPPRNSTTAKKLLERFGLGLPG